MVLQKTAKLNACLDTEAFTPDIQFMTQAWRYALTNARGGSLKTGA
jgi:hypothetical protein